MPNYYNEHTKFFVSVDCVIFGYSEGSLKLLIHRRPYTPYQGEWSVIGGFVEKDESIDDAAKRVLTEFTGLDTVYMRQLGAFGKVKRDPGERVISITYFALIDVAKYKRNNTQQSTAEWVDIDKLPPLVFDHNQMVDLSLQTVRSLVWKEPLIVNLMPKYFTLTQLQRAYETVIGKQLDKRNYRRTIIDQGFLVKTDKIDKKTSKRGAAIYQMNPEINC